MRRKALILITVAMIFGMLPGAAFAWCNGPAKGGKGNGYGSHDWILDQAIKQAGAKGAWVHRTTALKATDDPDTYKWASYTQHFFENGTCRGGPQTVSDLYHKAIVAYRAGDRATASKYLGQLSHCYADILQPFHDTKAANSYKSLHKLYEHAVDHHENTSTKSLSWLTRRPVEPVVDVRDKTISAALYARSFFPGLLSSFKKSHSVAGGTPLKDTKLLMSRAVNDLADIVAGIASGSGESATPANVDVSLSRTNPRPNQTIGTFVTLKDSNGAPMDGVRVKFLWRLPTGTATYSTYTDANGYASRYENIGASSIGKASLISTYVTLNGVTTSHSTAFTPVKR